MSRRTSWGSVLSKPMPQIAAAAGAKPSRAGPLSENGGGGGWGNQVGPLKEMAAAVARRTR